MRLISQDGTVDVPYERAVIVCSGGYISADVHGRRYHMATYGDPEKAVEMMDEVQDEFLDYPKKGIFQFIEDLWGSAST